MRPITVEIFIVILGMAIAGVGAFTWLLESLWESGGVNYLGVHTKEYKIMILAGVILVITGFLLSN